MPLVNSAVSVLCMSGFLFVINKVVHKDMCYQFTEAQQLAQVQRWKMKERLAILLGILYVIGTSCYVSVFLFMLPRYAASGYLQATLAAQVTIWIERFGRRGTEPNELFRTELGQNSFKIQEFSLEI